MIAASSGPGRGRWNPLPSPHPGAARNPWHSSHPADERKHGAPLKPSHLDQDVSGGAEAVEADPGRIASHAKRAVADQPRAQKRSSLEIREIFGQRKAEPAVGHRELGKAAIDLPAGEPRAVAEVLLAAEAVRADAAGIAEPRHAHARTSGEHIRAGPGAHDRADDLVAGDERQPVRRKLAVHDMEVRAADAASADAKQHLAGPRGRVGHVPYNEGTAGLSKQRGAHGGISVDRGRRPVKESARGCTTGGQ